MLQNLDIETNNNSNDVVIAISQSGEADTMALSN
jgi:D-arabinose 5-phosphate isomerase GutQ